MDELKKYLKQKEVDLQVDGPDEDHLWDRIAAGQPKKKQPGRVLLFAIRIAVAASVIFLVALGIRKYLKEDTKSPVEDQVVKKETPFIKDSSSVPGNITDPGEQPVAAVPSEKNQKRAVKSSLVKSPAPTGDSYAQLVNFQLQRLRSTPVYAESPEYFATFKQQLQQMDKDEVSLKNDINLYGLNEQLLEQLINIYQQKLNLLKSLQGEIHKMNSRVKEKQPPGRLSPFYLNI